MKKLLVVSLLLGMLATPLVASQPIAGDNTAIPDVVCPLPEAEPLQVGAYNWPASQLLREVLGRVLEHAYGCAIEPRDGLPQALEMALVRGELDLLVGVSSVTASMPLRDALAAGGLSSSVLYQQQAGFFVSETVVADVASRQMSDVVQRFVVERVPADNNPASPSAADTNSPANINLSDAVDASTANPDENPPAANVAVADTAAPSVEETPNTDPAVTDTSVTDPAITDASTTDASTTDLAAQNEGVASALPRAFVNCPSSWQCHDINLTKLAVYGADMVVVTPERAADVVASLQAAQSAQQPWFGFLWTPSWLVPTFALERLDEPAYSDACWQADRACAYPATDVLAVWRTDVAAQLPEDMRLLLSRLQVADAMSELLAFQQQTALVAAETAEAEDILDETVTYFLRNYPAVWQAWLEPPAAARVSRVLAVNNPTPSDAPTDTPETDTSNTDTRDTDTNDGANSGEADGVSEGANTSEGAEAGAGDSVDNNVDDTVNAAEASGETNAEDNTTESSPDEGNSTDNP